MSSISGKQLAKLLERNGWILLRIQGSQPQRERQKSLIQKSKVRTP